jgi:outer membrane lipoprotein-sorting protein
MRSRRFLFSAILLFAALGAVRAETVDEIINKHIDATGGAATWKKILAVKMEGSVSAQGMDIPLTFSKSQDKGFRMDMTVMGMSGYVIMTPSTGWVYMPFQGQKQPEAMTSDDIKDGLSELDIQKLLDYKQKGTTAELVGKEDVEGTECYKIKLTLKSGKTVTEFIDPSNYYVIREVQIVKANGKQMEQTNNFSNFKKLPEGITLAMTISSPMGDVTFTKVTINPTFTDSTFKSN